MTAIPPGPAVVGGKLVTVVRATRRNGADGYDVLSPTGDPGTSGRPAYSVFAPDWTVRPVVIGETVCEWARFSCYCGLVHVTVAQANGAGLTVHERCPGCGDPTTGAHGQGACV